MASSVGRDGSSFLGSEEGRLIVTQLSQFAACDLCCCDETAKKGAHHRGEPPLILRVYVIASRFPDSSWMLGPRRQISSR
jgi:hypothetical protein